MDTPFQMDHPDLTASADEGWDVVLGQPISSSAGIAHSTLAAGLAAAVINNGIGVAGIAHSRLVPLNISESISDMYKAVIWAADHGIRVVNMSWTGGDSDTLNAAGAYLKNHARGMLVMAGGNAGMPPYATNQPDIYCISMTDAADAMLSLSGAHVDFAAPGWALYSTTTNGSYAHCTGTSYAAPIFSGVLAEMMAINPLLAPDEIIEVLKQTAVDKGPPGWDEWYGWGRIRFGDAAAEAAARRPRLEFVAFEVSRALLATRYSPAWAYTLWTASDPRTATWTEVPGAVLSTNDSKILLHDPQPAGPARFYRLEVRLR